MEWTIAGLLFVISDEHGGAADKGFEEVPALSVFKSAARSNFCCGSVLPLAAAANESICWVKAATESIGNIICCYLSLLQFCIFLKQKFLNFYFVNKIFVPFISACYSQIKKCNCN